MTAWAGSTRKARLPADWQARRRIVLARDGHRCRGCGARATDVDHIVTGDNHGLTNLQALCRACHLDKTAREASPLGNAARWAPDHRAARAPEPHPGLCG